MIATESPSLSRVHWYAELYLDKVQQPAESPGDRVEPLRARVGPARVHQLGQVAVGEVAAPAVGGEVLLSDVARGEVAHAQEVTGAPDVALLLGGEGGQTRGPHPLLGTLPS